MCVRACPVGVMRWPLTERDVFSLPFIFFFQSLKRLYLSNIDNFSVAFDKVCINGMLEHSNIMEIVLYKSCCKCNIPRSIICSGEQRNWHSMLEFQ